MAPSYYLHHCWLNIKGVLWHSLENNYSRSAHELIICTTTSPRTQWVKAKHALSKCEFINQHNYYMLLWHILFFNFMVECHLAPCSMHTIDKQLATATMGLVINTSYFGGRNRKQVLVQKLSWLEQRRITEKSVFVPSSGGKICVFTSYHQSYISSHWPNSTHSMNTSVVSNYLLFSNMFDFRFVSY